MARRGAADSFSMKLSGSLTEKLDRVFGDVANEIFRPGAFAASSVIYDEMKVRVPRDEGTLGDSIYRYRDKVDDQNKSIFYIGPNKRIAQHWWLVEFGHVQVYKVYKDKITGKYWTDVNQPLSIPKQIAARPYIRPTYDAVITKAFDVGLQEMGVRLKNKFAEK